MNFFAAMLSEDATGQSASTMRVCSLVIVLAVMGTWAYTSIVNKTLQPLSAEQTCLVLGTLGVKAWQRGKEDQTTK